MAESHKRLELATEEDEYFLGECIGSKRAAMLVHGASAFTLQRVGAHDFGLCGKMEAQTQKRRKDPTKEGEPPPPGHQRSDGESTEPSISKNKQRRGSSLARPTTEKMLFWHSVPDTVGA